MLKVIYWGPIILGTAIIFIWLIAGKYEWTPPSPLIKKIEDLRKRTETDCVETITLAIEAREFSFDDIEKEIYITRKSRKPQLIDVRMQVNIADTLSRSCLGEEEKQRTKQRLEKRFPGLTVDFCDEKQVEKHAVLCDEQS